MGGGGYFVFSAGFCDVVVFVHHIAEERLPVFFYSLYACFNPCLARVHFIVYF